MKTFALIATAVLIGAAVANGVAKAPAKTSATAPAPAKTSATAKLLAEADKHESAGQYAQAAKSARAALASVGPADVKQTLLIRKQLLRLARRLSSARRLQALAAELARKDGDVTLRERIIKLCVVELDNPAMAMKFVNEETDQILQTYVPLAAGKLSELGEAACRELAEWYLSHLKKPSCFGRIAMLRRVAAYYSRFLKLHKSVDDEQRHAISQYASAVRSLSELGETFEKAPN